MTELAEKHGRILAIGPQGSPASAIPNDSLDQVGERKVGWAAAAVFVVLFGLFISWIFLAPAAGTSSPAAEAGFPIAAGDNLEPAEKPPPSPTPAPVATTPIPAVVDQNPTEAPTFLPSPTFTATVPSPTPDSRSPEVLTLLEDEVRAVTGMGNIVYLGISNRVVALDVTDPTFPVWIGEAGGLPGAVVQLAQAAEHIYALHPGGVSVIDVSEPGDLVQVGYFETDPGLVDLIAGPGGIYAPIRDEQGSALQVFSIANPSAPRPTGSAVIVNEPHDFKVVGARGYLTHGSQLSILDLSDPGDILPVGTYEFPGAALAVVPHRNHAFVGVTGAGIYVLNLADPAAPDVVSVYPLVGEVISIHDLYDGVLVALTDTKVALFDVSQPAALHLLGEYPLPGRLLDFQLTDEIAFVALGESGMLVIDLSQ